MYMIVKRSTVKFTYFRLPIEKILFKNIEYL